MKKELTEPLSMLGLEEGTSQTYVACLKLGKSKANDIAKEAEIHRTVIYRHLDELVKLGLISLSNEGGTRIYTPANPTRIGDIIKEKMAQTELIIPTLLALYSAASPGKPAFRYYTDSKGVRVVFEEILACHRKFYRHIGGFTQQDFRRTLGDEWMTNWTERRIENGVDHQSIRPLEWKENMHNTNPLFTGIGKAFLRDYRFAPVPGNLPILIYLFDEKVAFISGRPDHIYAAVLESADIFNTLNSLFEIIWNVAEPPVNAPTIR